MQKCRCQSLVVGSGVAPVEVSIGMNLRPRLLGGSVTKVTKKHLKVRHVDNDIILGIQRALLMSWLTDKMKGFLKVTQTVRIDKDQYKSVNGNARLCHVIL